MFRDIGNYKKKANSANVQRNNCKILWAYKKQHQHNSTFLDSDVICTKTDKYIFYYICEKRRIRSEK